MDINEIKIKCVELAQNDKTVLSGQKTIISVADEYFSFITKSEKNIVINIKEIVGNCTKEILEDIVKNCNNISQ